MSGWRIGLVDDQKATKDSALKGKKKLCVVSTSKNERIKCTATENNTLMGSYLKFLFHMLGRCHAFFQAWPRNWPSTVTTKKKILRKLLLGKFFVALHSFCLRDKTNCYILHNWRNHLLHTYWLLKQVENWVIHAFLIFLQYTLSLRGSKCILRVSLA